MADFDPVGLAIDWLDGCKRNDWDHLAALYAVGATATVPFNDPAVPDRIIKGRPDIAAYWKTEFGDSKDAQFELVELYPGVDSAILIYYDEHCRRVAEFLQFDADGLIVASARHAIPRRRQDAGLLGERDMPASPMRNAMFHCEARQTLSEARRLPIGPTRNHLRQRAVALRELSRKGRVGQASDAVIG